MELRNPNVRERIIELLATFASTDAQVQSWATPHDFEDDAQDLVDAVGEDDARPGIGDVFFDLAEAEAAADVLRALDRVWTDLGTNVRRDQLQAHPRWSQVMAAASGSRRDDTRLGGGVALPHRGTSSSAPRRRTD